MNKTDLFSALDRQLAGDVRTDPLTRKLYSVDASIFRYRPQVVVLPRTAEDIQCAIAFAGEHGLTVTARGAATGLTGGCLGDGMIIDTGRYMNRILEIDWDRREARCEVGVIQDQLNRAAGEHGLRLGPDTSTGNRATLGGMLGNNSSGAHSLRFGQMADHVLNVDLIDSTAERLHFNAVPVTQLATLARKDGTIGRVYREFQRIRTDLRAAILRDFPKTGRRVGGYNIDRLLHETEINPAQLICGAEGTFGVAAELRVRLSPAPPATGLSVLHFNDLFVALHAVEWCLTFSPYALELIDDRIVHAGQRSPSMAGRLNWLDGNPRGLLVVEFEGESQAEVQAKLDTFAAAARTKKLGYANHLLTEPDQVADVWALRKAGLGMLMSSRTQHRAVAFMEDTAVPVKHLPEFMEIFRDRVKKTGREAGFYGHAGGGCIHVRPMMDLRNSGDIQDMLNMMEELGDHLKRLGGALSSEHGDGLIRSWLNERLFGPEIYQGFRSLKAAFDPENRMNPGKIVDAPKPTEHLRLSPETPDPKIPTVFDFSGDGGFCFAVEMCNGNGECRKPDSGLMCPAFQATGEEKDSTRGRATLLQEILHGERPLEKLSGEELYEVMDLCLQCKGCKKECPSEVDMARLKAEFLHFYYQQHGTPLRNWIFGSVDRLSALASLTAPLTNRVQRTAWFKAILDRIGIDRRRKLPEYALTRFSRWYRRHTQEQIAKPAAQKDKIVLFVDTWTEFNEPDPGKAAIKVLTHLGCDIVVPPHTCCGRPQISKGMLEAARHKAQRVIDRLEPYVSDGYTVIGLEPSCLLTIRDEYRALIPGPCTELVADACLTIDEYLHQRLQQGTLNLKFAVPNNGLDIRVHGHCHQKSLSNVSMTTAVLSTIPGARVEEIDSGCCGMAGAFGYEKEHYEISIQIGETRLFPAVRNAPTKAIIVADGISCRSQIEHGTQRQPQHMIQVLADLLATPESE